jgi:hypothetical protein
MARNQDISHRFVLETHKVSENNSCPMLKWKGEMENSLLWAR